MLVATIAILSAFLIYYWSSVFISVRAMRYRLKFFSDVMDSSVERTQESYRRIKASAEEEKEDSETDLG